jgi:hypothetical protein
MSHVLCLGELAHLGLIREQASADEVEVNGEKMSTRRYLVLLSQKGEAQWNDVVNALAGLGKAAVLAEKVDG